jgi:anaerobic dimethyl sulfoxide reductase subunit B (iron-sulfur subunit)
MQQAFYFDQTRCTGCHACVVACKDWNDLPAELVFWRRVETYEEGKFPDVRVYHVTVSCNHCEKPACAEACPEEAIVKRDDGVVLIDDDKCTGCQVCEDACPYGAIQFRPGDDAKAEKCTFCSDRLAGGEIPVCVGACPMRALDCGDLESLADRPEVSRTAKHLPDGAYTTGSLLIKSKL